MNDVVVEGLKKAYGPVQAVRGISFQVARGEIFGIIGPNGAGKTTTLELLIGLRKPDAGRLQVLGLDPITQAEELRERIGVQLQASSIREKLRVGEALQLFSAFYGRHRPVAELIERLNLGPYLKSQVKNLSGGTRQRLTLALALINDPELIVLDEPSSGLDPIARHDLWTTVREMKAEGKTILLTSHYMDEVQNLTDRIAIIAEGRIVDCDTVEGLIERLAPGGTVDDVYITAVDRARKEVG